MNGQTVWALFAFLVLAGGSSWTYAWSENNRRRGPTMRPR